VNCFERIFNGDGEKMWEFIRSEDGTYTPCFENGQLCLRKEEEIFPISEQKFAELNILGTDGTKWIYCVSSGTELFRMYPLGNKEVLFRDDSGRIGTLRLEDYGNVAFFTAGAEKGYGIYRIHLPSKKVEILAQEQEPITLWWPDSNFQIDYCVGNPEAGGEDRTTPAKEWDLSDPNVRLFQKLLEPSEDGALNGYNNWYNAATLLSFDRPEAISLSGLMRNGFRDLSTKLTEEELAALGSAASGDKDYFKLPGDRVEAVLKMLTGLQIKDLSANTLQGGQSLLQEPILYLEKTDTYYVPCPISQDEDTPSIYIYKQDIEVHLVETLEDETYRVFYMGYTPAPFWSATDLQEKVMVLKKSADGWHVLSNGVAVSPMES